MVPAAVGSKKATVPPDALLTGEHDDPQQHATRRPAWLRLELGPGHLAGDPGAHPAGPDRGGGRGRGGCPAPRAHREPGGSPQRAPAADLAEGELNVHGHIHQNPPPTARYFNASVERIDYWPVLLQRVLDQLIEVNGGVRKSGA